MKSSERRLYIMTLLLTLLLLVGFTVYNFVSFYSNAIKNIEAVGENALAYETEQLNGYLNKGMNVLKATAITTEYLMDKGYTAKEIEQMLTNQSDRYLSEIDENFTGIYGWVMGEYVDGIGWVPEPDYVPKEREWYQVAAEAGGDAVIVPPYLDAQTHTVMISVAQMLKDGDSVISLDIALNEIQALTEEMGLDDMGYGFVVVRDGMVVAHHNSEELGKNYYDDDAMRGLLENIPDRRSVFDFTINGEECKVFTNTVMDDLRVVLIIESEKLYAEIHDMLVKNIILCAVIFTIIVIFCTIAFRRLRLSMEREERFSRRLEQQNSDIIKTIVRIIDAKDRYTNGHSQRVANYSREIARRLGKTGDELQNIYYAGLMHDVGKIRVPESVINKPGKLDDEEFRQIKIHPVTGYYILKEIYKEGVILQGARFHHERYDGKGYPMGISGENIPEIARIVGVADAYDAMASDRSYRKALPQGVVRYEIEKGKGTQFDPYVADVMLAMIDEDKDYNMRQADSVSKTILAADTQAFTIRMISDILSDNPDYNIVGAQSMEEVLQFVGEMDVNLLLLDSNMVSDVKAAAASVRAVKDIPIVLLTADRNSAEMIELTKKGVSDFITKPVSPYILQEIVHGILD